MTDSVRQLFLQDAGRDEMWHQAKKDGLMALREDAMASVKDGVTTPYEVMRVLYTLE